MDYNDNLCVNELNNISRPPEIDDSFLEFFKPKPKLRIKYKTKEIDKNNFSILRDELNNEDENILNNKADILIKSGDEINENKTNEVDLTKLNETNHDFYIENNNEKFNKESKNNDDLFKNRQLSGDKNTTRSDLRKRKLNVSDKENFFSVVTPISPYVISPKNNEFKFKENNFNNKELTEKNIDILKSLIEIREKELNNLNANYSYEKSEYKLEIIRLKEKIKESEESHISLKRELVEKDEIITDLKRNLEKLEFDYISTKESLEIMLDAERAANKNLREELRMKTINENKIGVIGDNNFADQQNYKYKYFEAMNRLQKLETELVLKKNYSSSNYFQDENNYFNKRKDSLPIFVGVPESKNLDYNKDKKLQVSVETCLNIKGSELDVVYNNEEIIHLVSENRVLHENIIKLTEELELERNNSIVASIRQFTQKPISVSSSTNTRLYMNDLDIIELKAKLYENKYEKVHLSLQKWQIDLRIEPTLINKSFNTRNINKMEIFPDLNFKINNFTQTYNEFLISKEFELHINEMIKDQADKNTSSFVKEVEQIDFYNLAFENYDFVPKMLNNKSVFNKNCINVENKNIQSKHKFEKVINSITELKSQVFQLRELISLTLRTPPNLFEIIKRLIHNDDVSETLMNKETFLYDVSYIISEAYRIYVEYVRNVENIFYTQKKEWKEYSTKLESQIKKYSQEKMELINEIDYLKQILNQKLDTESDISLSQYNFKYNAEKLCFKKEKVDENIDNKVLSCYNYTEKYNDANNKFDPDVNDLSVTQLLNSPNSQSENKLIIAELSMSENSQNNKLIDEKNACFSQIMKLQGRIRSFRNNNLMYCVNKSISETSEYSKSLNEDLSPNKKNSVLSLRKDELLTEIKTLMNGDKNYVTNKYLENGNILVRHTPHQINSDELIEIKEFENITGTTMMLRLYRYHKQTKTLEKQVMQLTKEKQKLELEYEKDLQSIQMDLLSTKLIIEARDAEIKVLKEKCDFLNKKIEEDILNIKLAAREEIEKVWKPKVEDFNNKCEDYLFKIGSLESELLILRQQLAFQKQINSKEFRQNDQKEFIKNKYLSKSYNSKFLKLNETPKQTLDNFKIIQSENKDQIDESEVLEQDLISIHNSEEEDQNDTHLTTLQAALSRLKSISSKYSSE